MNDLRKGDEYRELGSCIPRTVESRTTTDGSVTITHDDGTEAVRRWNHRVMVDRFAPATDDEFAGL